MYYFVVQAVGPSGQTLAEEDVLLRELYPLVDEIEEQLRAQGIFQTEARVLKRFVPAIEPAQQEMIARISEAVPDSLGTSEYDVYVDESRDPSEPLRSLSVWLCSVLEKRTCKVDFSIDWLLRSAKEYLLERLAKQADIRDWNAIRFNVRLQGAKQPLVEVKVTNRESLVDLERRSWRDYNAELRGTRKPGDLRVLINAGVIRQLEEVAQDSLQKDAEVGGFVVGNVYEDEEGEIFVDASDVVPAGQATGSFLSLRFNQEAWRQVFDDINQRFPHKMRVGWYHTHLIGSYRLEPVALPELAQFRTYQLVQTVFFSQADVFLHRNFFPEPWHIALVVDLKRFIVQIYQWEDGEIVPCQGYYIYEDAL